MGAAINEPAFSRGVPLKALYVLYMSRKNELIMPRDYKLIMPQKLDKTTQSILFLITYKQAAMQAFFVFRGRARKNL